MLRHRLSVLLAATAMVATQWTTGPARADTDACTGNGGFAPLEQWGPMPLLTPEQRPFAALVEGMCAGSETQVWMYGDVDASCTYLSGFGDAYVETHGTMEKHTFAFAGTTTLVLTGEVQGVLPLVPRAVDFALGCTRGDNFVHDVVGAVLTFNHDGCTLTTTTAEGYPVHRCA